MASRPRRLSGARLSLQAALGARPLEAAPPESPARAAAREAFAKEAERARQTAAQSALIAQQRQREIEVQGRHLLTLRCLRERTHPMVRKSPGEAALLASEPDEIRKYDDLVKMRESA